MNPFAIPEAAVSLSVTSGTSRVALLATGGVVRICNVGSGEAFVKAGDSTVEATTSCMSVPAGSIEVFTLPPTATHMAAITASGTTTLRIARGEGF